jgi:hypothetical protein
VAHRHSGSGSGGDADAAETGTETETESAINERISLCEYTTTDQKSINRLNLDWTSNNPTAIITCDDSDDKLLIQ